MKIYLKSLLLLVFLVGQYSFADIYSYLDNKGQRHFVNEPIKGAELVKRLSPITEESKAEDVQKLLSSPRFSRIVSMKTQLDAFHGNYPKPIAFSTQGFRIGDEEVIVKPTRGLLNVNARGKGIYAPYITMIARQYGLHPALLHAVITTESAYNPKARSHAGAMGLMQLIPATAKRFGVEDPYDPIQNMHGGAAYLRFLIDHFGDISLALAGYNAGEGAVRKYGNKIPPYKETMHYVPKVLAYYHKYRQEGY